MWVRERMSKQEGGGFYIQYTPGRNPRQTKWGLRTKPCFTRFLACGLIFHRTTRSSSPLSHKSCPRQNTCLPLGNDLSLEKATLTGSCALLLPHYMPLFPTHIDTAHTHAHQHVHMYAPVILLHGEKVTVHCATELSPLWVTLSSALSAMLWEWGRRSLFAFSPRRLMWPWEREISVLAISNSSHYNHGRMLTHWP